MGTGGHGGLRGERSHWREGQGRGVWKGLSHGQKLIHLILLSPSPPPLLVFQTVSINKAINTQVVAVKEKHARNILLEVVLKTDPEEHQLGQNYP